MSGRATSGGAIKLTASEGEALKVAEVLVGRARGGLPSVIAVDEPSPALSEAVARTLAAASLQFLLHSGGGELRLVLRNGRRQTGRLWDEPLNAGFEPRFSTSSRDLWWNAAKKLVPLSHRKRKPATADQAGVTRDDRKLVKDATPDIVDGAGDLVFFAVAHENTSGLGLLISLEEQLRHELRVASPLAYLLCPDDPEIDVRAARGMLHTLTTPANLRVMECVDNALVAAWLARFRAIVVHAQDRTDFLARVRALSRTLRIWLELLDGANRMDLSRSIARFLAKVPGSLVAGLDIRAHCLRLPGTTSMAERDESLAALREVLDLRRVLDDARTNLGSQRYGDERYEEGQILLRMLDTELLPHRDGLEAMARTVSGAVG